MATATGRTNHLKGNPVGSRRTLITIASLAVGVLAAFMIYSYVGSVKDEAFGEAEKVDVFVVKQNVPKGTYGEETQASAVIAQDQIPKRFWPENAIRSFDDIAGKVAVGDLAVNQIVTTDMFADPSTVQTTFSDRLEKINGEDQVGISIQVDEVRGVAGLLQPGDFVNIMLTKVCGTANPAAGAQTEEGAEPAASGDETQVNPYIPETRGDPEDAETWEQGECEQAGLTEKEFQEQENGALKDAEDRVDPSERFPARYLMQKVQILAIDQTPVQLPGETSSASAEEGAAEEAVTAGTGLVTLIVPARAAQYIASVDPNDIYLTLVPRDYQPVPLPGIDSNHDALPGEDPDMLTPYGPEGPGGE